jgi:WD40 repeat protein
MKARPFGRARRGGNVLRLRRLITACAASLLGIGIFAEGSGVASAQDQPQAQTRDAGADTGARGWTAPVDTAKQPDAALQQPEPRLALVIGNARYQAAPLANPANDAHAIATKLHELGFTVIEKENATLDDMERLSREFGNRLGQGGVGVFYFAGHGIQSDGSNYLLPVDADVQDETELGSRTYNAQEILSKMESAKNRLNIVILDACRNNPLPRASRSAVDGLAQMKAGTGTFIAYATQPGATAADGGSTGHSLYTEQLLEALSQRGLRIEDVFKQVRTEVSLRTARRQTPWDSSSLIGDFYFNPTAEQVVYSTTTPYSVAPATASLVPDSERSQKIRPTNQLLVPRKLLDSYQLFANLSMPAPGVLAEFTASGAYFALVTQDRQLRLWDVKSGSVVLNQDGFDSPTASSDGRYIVGIADDHTLNVLDTAATSMTVRPFRGMDAVRAMIPNPHRLVVYSRAGLLSLHDLDSGRPLGQPVRIQGEPNFAVSPTGSRLLAWGSSSSDMYFFDLESGKRLGRTSSHDKPVNFVRFSRDGAFFLTAADGDAAIVWRASDGANVTKLNLGGSAASLTRAEFVDDGKRIVAYVGQPDPTVGVLYRLAIWDAASGKLLGTVFQRAVINDLRYSSDGQKLYFSTSDNTIHALELNTKTQRTLLTDASLVGFSADGQRMLVHEEDGLRLYDSGTLVPVARMPGQTSAFISPASSPIFVTTSSDDSLRLWDFEKGQLVAELKGHLDAVSSISFASGGRHLVSFGKGRTAKLWSLPEVHDVDKLARDTFESSAEYTRRVSEWSSTYTALVSLGDYDADSEAYALRLGDITLTLPTRRDDARRFAGQREAILTGKLKVFDVDQLQLSDAKLERLP